MSTASPKPPKVFRAMYAQNDLPACGSGYSQLGVRIPSIQEIEAEQEAESKLEHDVEPDEEGNVKPCAKGMSVYSGIARLPPRVIPTRLRAMFTKARGEDDLRIWCRDGSEFKNGYFATQLILTKDQPRKQPHHAVIEPADKMTIHELQYSLAATVSSWMVCEESNVLPQNNDLESTTLTTETKDVTMEDNNTAFTKYESILIELQQSMAAGDDEQSKRLRMRLEPLESQMSEESQLRLDGLSADLYMLSDDELFEPHPGREIITLDVVSQLRENWYSSHWLLVLELLRLDVPSISQEHRAYLRSIAYSKLNQFYPALLFMQYAIKLNKEDNTYRYFELGFLRQAGKMQEATTLSTKYAEDPLLPPIIRIEAMTILSQDARSLPDDAELEALRKFIPLLTESLQKTNELASTPVEVIAQGYVLLGTCLLTAGQVRSATSAFQYALNIDPDNDAARDGLTESQGSSGTNPLRIITTIVPAPTPANSLSITHFESAKAEQIWRVAA